ncbi:methyltransferase [Gordonia sp. (in: high G+C Gram-positive bacteria)]|uniref:methyltransferase n=1 Tax=Gordonia sp. (in: high G+C Gram-positive bacteria) TaxID=84139 RepID=UPI00260C2FFE|nr:methyltransferase [Gordonia sp. (in: high G+C Gram-positive bacteria)]
MTAPAPAAAATVYRPQEDTRLLIDALSRLPVRGRRVLDLCTGSGPVAAAALRLGAREVIGVDSSEHAVAAARARSSSPTWTTLEGTVAEFTHPELFDIVTCNPPYVPAPSDPADCRAVPGPAHAWDAGIDGRAVLDTLCRRASDLVAPEGHLLVVQSQLAQPERTWDLLHHNGFHVVEAGFFRIPFGPVIRARRGWLIRRGLLGAHEPGELLTVLLARRSRR